jgi:Bestrophin, RFP-TM, chloride channel
VAVQVLLTFQMMSHIIENSGINDFQALQMQQNVTTFEDILGGSERLLRTPIPVSYTRHTSRFLLIWLTVLPFALYSQLEWASVPAVGFIALLLLGARSLIRPYLVFLTFVRSRHGDHLVCAACAGLCCARACDSATRACLWVAKWPHHHCNGSRQSV